MLAKIHTLILTNVHGHFITIAYLVYDVTESGRRTFVCGLHAAGVEEPGGDLGGGARLEAAATHRPLAADWSCQAHETQHCVTHVTSAQCHQEAHEAKS